MHSTVSFAYIRSSVVAEKVQCYSPVPANLNNPVEFLQNSFDFWTKCRSKTIRWCR